MELRQLEYFVAVAEEANFTRAAERVHISQSGVSAQVRTLEAELGGELFDRSGRVARLTPAGAAILPLARAALDAASSIREVVDEVNGLIRGRLTAGMITGCEVKPWFEALAAFHGAHPGIDIELHEGNSDQLVGSVLTGLSDIALVGLAGEPPPGLSSEIIIAEGLAAIVAPSHPLARKRQDQERPSGEGTVGASGVSLTELTAYPLVCLPVGTGIRSVLDQACAAADLLPDIALEASAPGAVADLGSRGMGVAVLSRSMAAGFPDLIAVPITGIEIPALLALVWRPKKSPATAALLAQCRRAFALDDTH
jgi:DNA-binding transcriptional LysR family regulator